MGTRNLMLVKKNGEYKVAKYCQWDGYYEGQGQSIVEFLRRPGNIEKLREHVDFCGFIDHDELERRWRSVGADEYAKWVTLEQGEQFGNKWPELSRDYGGGDVLAHICEMDSELLMINDLEFAANSLFCEYAYCVDFDDNTFSWYMGFNTQKLDPDERFAFLNEKAYVTDRGDVYYPVRQEGCVPLKTEELPDWSMEGGED